MGIVIHYKGRINKVGEIENFVDEISDISKELGWGFRIIDDSDKQLNGIILQPHEDCEPVSFLFDNGGRLHSIGSLLFDDWNKNFAFFASTKTQFAPLDVHIAIIKLLKYIKSKYINDLEVTDEADYWDTMDEAVLKEKMEFLGSKIELMGEILDSRKEELLKTKSPGELVSKIEGYFKKIGFTDFRIIKR